MFHIHSALWAVLYVELHLNIKNGKKIAETTENTGTKLFSCFRFFSVAGFTDV